MTRRDKLVQRIVQRPPTASFRDVRNLLEDYGWIHARTKGSHAIFTKPGERSITVPIKDGNEVKRVYLDQICNRLDLDVDAEAS